MGSLDRPDSEPKCETLKGFRERYKVGRSKLAAVCFLASLREELGDETVIKLVQLALRDDVGKCVDYNNLARFESGRQRPWKSAISNLCFVFSILTKKEIVQDDLFPELRRKTVD